MLREHAFFMTTPSPQPSPAPAPGGQCTDIAPAGHNLTCAQQQSRGKCSQGWMKGYCCKTCFDCKAGCGKASGHVNTPKVVKAAPDDTPPVTTAPVVNGFSCSNRTNATQHAVRYEPGRQKPSFAATANEIADCEARRLLTLTFPLC